MIAVSCSSSSVSFQLERAVRAYSAAAAPLTAGFCMDQGCSCLVETVHASKSVPQHGVMIIKLSRKAQIEPGISTVGIGPLLLPGRFWKS